MESIEFSTIAGLEEAENSLARASRHPVHVDLGTEYNEGGVAELTQQTFDSIPAESGQAERTAAESRLERVEPQSDIYVVWNNRDDRRAYIGSKRYNLIQHREVIDAIREAVGRTTGSIDKGVVRDYGEHVNGTLVFGDQDEAVIDVEDLVGDGYIPPEGSDWTRDRLGLGMRFHNSFDGRSGYGGTTMGYRYICGNWMVWGEQEIAATADYHIKGEDETPGVDPDYFEEVIGAVFKARDPLADTVKEAIEEGEVPTTWVPSVLEDAGFGGNYQEDISAKVQYWVDGDETDLWTIYNAATHYLDHERAEDLGPERYDHHQGSAWAILENEPGPPEEEPETLEEFAAGVS